MDPITYAKLMDEKLEEKLNAASTRDAALMGLGFGTIGTGLLSVARHRTFVPRHWILGGIVGAAIASAGNYANRIIREDDTFGVGFQKEASKAKSIIEQIRKMK